MLDWARYYAGLGLRVLPITEGRKSPPMLTQWPERATTDYETVAAWWTSCPGSNIGVATGVGSALVDVETDEGGEDSLSQWAASSGLVLPNTWSFRSGGGGIHRLYRCTHPDLQNRAGVLPAVDVRANGGYAVFPPSLHPSGLRYEWIPGLAPAELPDGPATLPFELFGLLTGDRNKKSLEVPEEIIEGGRNDTLFRLACKLRRDGLTEGEILAAVSVANETRCVPPLDVDEVETICRQATVYKAGELPKGAVQAKALNLTPMSDVEAKRPSYLISPYLPRGMLSIMGGVSGSGKTYLALSWAAAVSNGCKLPFQSWDSPAPPAGHVYYFTQENDPNTVLRPRLDQLGANLDKILTLTTSGATYDPLTLNDPRLEDAALLYPPSLIIFDPIQSYLGAGVDMNKAERVRPVLDWLGDFAKRHKCSIVLVSHMSKPGAGNTSALDRLLGSSDFRNAARSIIVVGHDPDDKDYRVFAHGKNSIGAPGESQRYHIDSALGVVYDGPSDLSADDILRQGDGRGKNKPAITLSNAVSQLENLLGPEGCATLEQVDALQSGAGMSQRTMYNARRELALQSVYVGQPPNRKTWWVRPDVDIAKFKAAHEEET